MQTKLFKRQWLLFLLSVFPSGIATATEISLSGFGSVFVGKTLSGDRSDYFSSYFGIDDYQCPCTIADYINGGIYEDSWRFEPDTNIGGQAVIEFSETLSVTAQATAYAARDFDIDLTWLLFRYQLTDKFSIDLGRKRLPLFYYSDFYDIGYAIPWVRPPGDLYGWPVQSFNGISFIYRDNIAGGTFEANFWSGNEKVDEVYGYQQIYFGRKLEIRWNDMVGLSLDFTRDWYNVRVIYMENQLNQFEDFPPWTQTQFDRQQKFLGLAINLDFENWFVKSEYNQFKRKSPDFSSDAYSLSIGYLYRNMTFALGYSDYADRDLVLGREIQNSKMASFRWDFAPKIAFKFQLDVFNDNTDWNGIEVVGGDFIGDSEAITAGFDFIF